jgi:hypothetical protein
MQSSKIHQQAVRCTYQHILAIKVRTLYEDTVTVLLSLAANSRRRKSWNTKPARFSALLKRKPSEKQAR